MSHDPSTLVSGYVGPSHTVYGTTIWSRDNLYVTSTPAWLYLYLLHDGKVSDVLLEVY